MSRNYKFHNPKGLYFVSFTVVEWLDVFTRNIYKDILLESLTYCQKEKGMEIYSWVIMTNHVHLVFRSIGEIPPNQILGDFKRHTSKALVKAISQNDKESRRDLFMEVFRRNAEKKSNVNNYQFWQHESHPIEIWSNKIITRKINYIHNNPTRQGFVAKPEDYVHSSASNYVGKKGPLDGVVIFNNGVLSEL